MFKDREKALEELQRLLEDEEEIPEEDEEYDEDSQEEDAEDECDEEASVDMAATRRVRAYNADSLDTDLEDYSRDVYEAPKKGRCGCALWLGLLTAAVLLAISWYLAKQGGLL